MLTEANALDYIRIDAQRMYGLAEKGAVLADLQKKALVTVLQRVKSFESNRATKTAIAAANQPKTAPTLSEQIAARILTVFEHTAQVLPPEDSRALGLYLCGVPPQAPGFIAHLMNAISESSGEQAAELCIGRIKAFLEKLHVLDRDLFENQVKIVKPAQQRIIAGCLLEAQWAFAEQYGTTARNHIIHARRLARKWIEEARDLQARQGGSS